MITSTHRRPIPAAFVAAAVTLASAAAAPSVRAQADPGAFVPSPEGTVTVYQRKSEGSYGVYEGPVRWTYGVRDWNGRAVASVTSERHGMALHDPKTWGLVAQLTSAGEPTLSFVPDIPVDWPIAVGKAWTSTHEITRYRPPGVLPLVMKLEVKAYEDITVPAGTFKAFKVVQTSSYGEVDQTWVVPSMGNTTIQRIMDRPASHPQGAGHLEGVLVSRTVPARR